MLHKKIIHFTLSLIVCSSFYACKKAASGGSSSTYGVNDGWGGYTSGHTVEGTNKKKTEGEKQKGGTDDGTDGGCNGETNEICKGGYDAATNKKEIPAKVWFLNPIGSPLTGDMQGVANALITKANSELVFDSHRFIKFSTPIVEGANSPSMNQILDSNYMINNYGSTGHYVLILVKNLVAQTGGTIGYSPGLRIDWKIKNSIVVMDYDYVVNQQNGKQVIIHELFHGLGAPHTTDANGRQDDVFSNGVQIYKDIKSQGYYALLNRSMDHDFKIHIEDSPNFQGVRNIDGNNWDTRTLMMWYATNTTLFLNSDTALNGSYSNILSVYYDSFVKE